MNEQTGQTPPQQLPDLPYNRLADEDVPYAENVSRAVASYHASQAKLKHPTTGRSIYSEEARAERTTALLATFDAEVERPIALLERQVADAEKALAAIAGTPYERLPTDELARAGSLAAFVREDFRTQPLAALVERCQIALSQGKKAEMVVTARAAAERLAEEHSQYPALQHGEQGVALGGQHPEGQALAALRRLVGSLEDALAPPDAAKKREALAQARRELMGLRRLAGKARSTLDGSAGQLEARMRARYGL